MFSQFDRELEGEVTAKGLEAAFGPSVLLSDTRSLPLQVGRGALRARRRTSLTASGFRPSRWKSKPRNQTPGRSSGLEHTVEDSWMATPCWRRSSRKQGTGPLRVSLPSTTSLN